MSTRLSRTLFAIVLAALVLAGIPATSFAPVSAQAQAPGRPNIVIILSDDQRADTIDWPIPGTKTNIEPMPKLNSRLLGTAAGSPEGVQPQAGLKFTHGYVTTALCCPSRSTLLTGSPAHTTHVYRNQWGATCTFNGVVKDCGGKALDNTHTLATWLDNSGYQTTIIGKYLNQYPGNLGQSLPGWDEGHVVLNGDDAADTDNYADLQVQEWSGPGASATTEYCDGATPCVKYPGVSTTYSTDVWKKMALDFIDSREESTPGVHDQVKDDIPFLLYMGFNAPHSSQASPLRVLPAPPGMETLFTSLPTWRPSSYNESNISDKPYWDDTDAENPLLSNSTNPTPGQLDTFRQDQYRALRSLDDAVGAIFDELALKGELSNTLIVYTSDNGYMWGEHRLAKKIVPYEESIRVPFVFYYQPLVDPGRTDSSTNTSCHPATGLVCMVEDDPVDLTDIVPTIRDIAGLDPADPGATPVDAAAPGISMKDQLDRDLDFYSLPEPRGEVFIESSSKTATPSYCEIRTSTRHANLNGVSVKNYWFTVFDKKNTEPLYKHREQYDMTANPAQTTSESSNNMTAAKQKVRDALNDRLFNTTNGMCRPKPPEFNQP